MNLTGDVKMQLSGGVCVSVLPLMTAKLNPF